MNLRRHLNTDIVESIRQRLDTEEAELLDKLEHDRLQIERCLSMFIQYIEAIADNTQEGPSDSQLLASISERLNDMASVIVTQDTFVTNLQAVQASVQSLSDKTTKQDALIEQLISLSTTLISKGTSGTSAPEDFSSEQTILDQISTQVANLSASGDTTTNDVNNNISALNTALNNAPVASAADTTAAQTAAANGATAATPLTTQTPAPVDSSASVTGTNNAAVSTTGFSNTAVTGASNI